MRWCTQLEGWLERQFTKHNRKAPKPWAERLVGQFSNASATIAHNPRGLVPVIGFAVLGSGLEMLCFICCGLAFGITEVNVLVAGYVVTNIFTVVSPSPNGVGVAEVAASVTLTAYGTSVSTATAVALVFRGFVFWIPFAIGALLLRRTGFSLRRRTPRRRRRPREQGTWPGCSCSCWGSSTCSSRCSPAFPRI